MKPVKSVDASDQLHVIISKMRFISHFLETQNPDHSLPLDYDDVLFGFYTILNETIKDLDTVRKDLE
tara:strand:- start:68080 stop:68280 length:201 start_codon:yes stop_codon:yes gene_type:complete